MADKPVHRTSERTLEMARELRKPQTPAEAKLWRHLRDRQLCGLKFRRQYPIGRFIVDFYCVEKRLIIEVDGDTHGDQADYDEARTEWLVQHEYKVIRFYNSDVYKEMDGVMETILRECGEND